MTIDYELGLRTLKARLPAIGLEEFHVLEFRLLDNLKDERLHGGTDTTHADRNKIVASLNQLALTHLGVSFNDLYEWVFAEGDHERYQGIALHIDDR